MLVSVASEPELQKKTLDAKELLTSLSATIFWFEILKRFEQCQIFSACVFKALTNAGWLCPRLVTPIPLVKSRYLVPSDE